MNKKADLVVIGAGPAGLAAAIEAKQAGVDKVLLIERDSYLGGLLGQCIHNGFGLQYFDTDLSGPEYRDRFIDMLKNEDIEVMMETMVLEVSQDRKISAVNSQYGVMNIDAGAIILAMGCRERPRGSINIFGSRPAGIFTAGSAQRIINIDGYLPGKEVVILGSGDIGMIMARRLTLANVKVKAVVEVLPYIGGLVRNEVQCLRDFNIPVYLSHTVSAIHGKQHITGVTISEVDDKIQPIPGTEMDIDCDTLLLSVGLIPENELSKAAGINISDVGGPIVDENMQTNIPGIFAAGNVVHVHDLVDYVTESAQVAGRAAAAYIKGQLPQPTGKIKVEKGQNIRYVVPQILNADKGQNCTLYMRVTKPADEVTLKMSDGVYTKKYKKVKPSEMLKIDLKSSDLEAVKNGVLTVECIIDKEEAVYEPLNDGSKEFICTTCPMACRLNVYLDENGNFKSVTGNTCKRGEEFAQNEITCPKRTLTGTVLTNDPVNTVLPVRSSEPIPKELCVKACEDMATIVVDKPVKNGDVIVKNILNTGVDIVAATNYPFD